MTLIYVLLHHQFHRCIIDPVSIQNWFTSNIIHSYFFPMTLNTCSLTHWGITILPVLWPMGPLLLTLFLAKLDSTVYHFADTLNSTWDPFLYDLYSQLCGKTPSMDLCKSKHCASCWEWEKEPISVDCQGLNDQCWLEGLCILIQFSLMVYTSFFRFLVLLWNLFHPASISGDTIFSKF